MDIQIVDNISYEESVKVFPEGTPAHVIEDLGVDMWKGLDQCGCKSSRYDCGVSSSVSFTQTSKVSTSSGP